MYIDVYECVECGYVVDYVFEDYVDFEVFQFFYFVGEVCCFEFGVWVVVGFFQFFEDVVYCWYIEGGIGELFGFQIVQEVVVVDQCFDWVCGGCYDVFDYWIGFWVY